MSATEHRVHTELGTLRVGVVGNSWGAMPGGVLAARHPDRVGYSILMNGTASAAPRRQRLELTALRTLAQLLRGIRGPLVRPVLTAFLGPTSLRERPDAVEHVARVARANHVRSAMNCVRSVVDLRPDNRELFGRITTPVLAIAGREDATFPLPVVEEMADSIPAAELLVVDDAAQLVAVEVPDRINAAIDDSLGRHARPSSNVQ